MMAPVHPMPTITTSTLSLMIAISAPPSGHVDRRQWIGLVADTDPIEVIGPHAGISDHLPRPHILVAAIFGVGEIAEADLVQELLEDHLAGNLLQLDLVLFQPFQHGFLLTMVELGKALAGEFLSAITIDRLDS